MAVHLVPILRRNYPHCPGDLASTLTLMCKLETWMPGDYLFCHHCLLYRPPLNFGKPETVEVVYIGADKDPHSSEPAHQDHREKSNVGRQGQHEKRRHDIIFKDRHPRCCFDCERTLPYIGYSALNTRVVKCVCGIGLQGCKISCSGCAVAAITKDKMLDSAFEHEIEEVDFDRRGPWYWCETECCDGDSESDSD